MKTFHINSQAKTIAPLNLADSNYTTIRAAIPTEWIEIIRLDADHCLVVDEEGLINGKWNTYFCVDQHTIAGNALVFALDDEGEFQEPLLELADLTRLITFPNVTFVGFQDSIDKSLGFARITRRAVFKERN